MNDSYYEELIRAESEEFAVNEFGMEYCDLVPSDRWRLREIMIQTFGADELFSTNEAQQAA